MLVSTYSVRLTRNKLSQKSRLGIAEPCCSATRSYSLLMPHAGSVGQVVQLVSTVEETHARDNTDLTAKSSAAEDISLQKLVAKFPLWVKFVA